MFLFEYAPELMASTALIYGLMSFCFDYFLYLLAGH